MTNPFRQIAAAWRRLVTHRDRVAPLEIRRQYGWNVESADRPWKKQHDLEAPLVNANVSIATRAISDAVTALKWEIVSVDTVGGIEREEEDRDHPANAIINDPNPEMTLREVMAHVTRSYLTDGNGILTIERLTGPNDRIEIWPRDPRPPYVQQRIADGRVAGYEFGVDDSRRMFYPRERVIHVRDMNPEDPLWGVSRIESVRDEIYMDYLINQFNKNFFVNAGSLLLMWNPKDTLTQVQHEQLMGKWAERAGDTDAFYRPFINQFAGSWSSPEQTHKDIAFEELTKLIRERIFGVFGLPPFRGGVMEYANYANALAQDKDFWNNTVKPVTARIEDAFNKQLIWRFWDRDVRLRCDYSDIPALKGEPKEQAEIYAIYVEKNIMTANEVRERLNLDPLEEDELPKPTGAVGDEDMPADDDADQAPKPTKDEEDETANALAGVFRAQKARLRNGLTDYTVKGRMMSRLGWPEEEANRLLSVSMLQRHMSTAVLPSLSAIGRHRGTFGHSVPTQRDIGSILQIGDNELLNLAQESNELLRGYLSDAATYGWSLSQLLKRTNGIFSGDRARRAAKSLTKMAVRQGEVIAMSRRIGVSPTTKEA
jgi:HK97 family phage portal protein